METSITDSITLSRPGTTPTGLAAPLTAGQENSLGNGDEKNSALNNSVSTADFQQQERNRIATVLMSESLKGLDDIAAGRTRDAEGFLHEIMTRRARK